MEKYDSYKDSGVEWIGEIPNDWSLTKMNYYCEVKDGTHDTPKYVDNGGHPLVTQKDITKGKLDFTKTKNISEEDYIIINKRSDVSYNDIIMSMIGSIGNPTIVDTKRPFSIKNVCLFKSSNSTENTKYIHYLLSSDFLDIELNYNSRGGVQGFVSLDVLRNLIYIKIPLHEQQQIVQFLDTKTSLIDTLIEKTQRKIELLKEKRTSLINHVVTRGLNPNVEMKDSGVEWIGEIPRDWLCGKLNYHTSRIGDGLHSTPKYVDNSEFRFINGNNLVNGKIKYFDSTKCVSQDEFQKHYIELDEDTLLLSINGTIGNLSFYQGEKVILGKSSCYIRTLSSINKYFLYYVLSSESINKYFTFELTGTTIFNLSLNSIRKTPLPLPELDVQQQIVEYLDEQTNIIDTTITKEQKRTILLKEYRQSLISNVVTGKIKVTTDE